MSEEKIEKEVKQLSIPQPLPIKVFAFRMYTGLF